MGSAVLVLLALVASASARPQIFSSAPTLTSRTHQVDDSGQYVWSYGQSDGQAAQETGFLKPGPEGLVVAKKGVFQHPTSDGKFVMVEYLADETGFHILNSKGLPVDPAMEALRVQQQGHLAPDRNFGFQNQFTPSFA